MSRGAGFGSRQTVVFPDLGNGEYIMKQFMRLILLMGVLLSIPLQVAAQGNVGPARTGLFADSPVYAVHGPHWVGTREFVIGRNTERPLDVTVWYPAINFNMVAEDVNYTYKPPPLRSVTVPGHAIADAYPVYPGGPYPLVLVSHGTDMNRFNLNYLSEHLASHGFVVMAANHTGNATGDAQFPFQDYTDSIAAAMVHRPRDIRRQIDFAAELAGKSGAFPGLIDMEHIAVLGHSYGGYTALAAAGARVNLTGSRQWCKSVENEPAVASGFGYLFVCKGAVAGEEKELAMLGTPVKPGETWPAFDVKGVDAVVLLGAWLPFGPGSFDNVKVPALTIVGAVDSNYAANKWLFETLPSTGKAFFVLDNASHEVLAECDDLEKRRSYPCGYAEQMWDPKRVYDRVRHVTTAFLLDALKGDKDAHKALLPGAVNFPGTRFEKTSEPTVKSRQKLERTKNPDVGDKLTYNYVRNGRSMRLVEEIAKVGETETRATLQADARTYEAVYSTRDMFWSHAICLANGQLCAWSPAMQYAEFPLEIGKTWSGKSIVTGETFVGEVTYQVKVDGIEKIATPAGQFDAYKVSASSRLSGTNKAGGAPWSGTESYADWWATITGKAVVVRTEYKNSFGETYTRELVSAELK
jgi:predicted dienelactone hydrolase